MHMALEETVHNSDAITQSKIQSAWISVGNLKVQSCRVRAVWVTPFGLQAALGVGGNERVTLEQLNL